MLQVVDLYYFVDKQMKLFLKILLFIFTMIIIMVGEIKSSTVTTIFQEENSSAFFQKSQLGTVLFEKHNTISCINKEIVVTCSERVTSTNAIVAKGGDDLLSFMSKSLSQKLDEIAVVWKTKYPVEEMLGGRTFFEKVMREYRYTKAAGWEYTADIASNFKGVDFYKGVTQGEKIYAETAVSMKTTITKDVNAWLNSTPIKDNINFLNEGLNTSGLVSNNKTMFVTNAEIHIYMPKENITDALKTEWLNKLNTTNPKIKFEIKSLEDYIK